MPTIPQFDPPGGLTDFDGVPNQRAAWNAFMNQLFEANIRDISEVVGAGKCQYYNPTTTSTDAPVAAGTIRWKGFPLAIASQHPGNKKAAWAAADVLDTGTDGRYRRQDEYLEWFTTRQNNKITRIDFTCEAPEYWESLAHGQPQLVAGATGDIQKVLALYRQYVSPDVQLGELLGPDGRYNGLNKWNTTHGAMHLTHPANTLGAEVNIAAVATILRQKGGQILTDADELIRCARYGDPERASDPTIGATVNQLAREGYAITLQNPVGLYIDSLEAVGWITPNGKPAIQFWKPVRGADGMTVRAVFEVPASEGYTVSDIKIGGQPILFAGQIAEHINVKLTGLACRPGSFHGIAQPCTGGAAGVAGLTAVAPRGRSRTSR